MSNPDSSMNNLKPRKVGRPRKKVIADNTDDNIVKPVKKRGRKPRGGKIVPIPPTTKNSYIPQQNIILHLRCCSNDLQNNMIDNSNTYSPNFSNNISYNLVKNINNDILPSSPPDNNSGSDNDNSVIWDKINNLAINLHNNSISLESTRKHLTKLRNQFLIDLHIFHLL